MGGVVIRLWIIWAGVAGAVILFALQQEVGAIRRQQVGANGLMWLAAMILGGLGALIAAAFAWMLADGQQALVLLGAAAAVLIALGFLSVKRIQAEIRMALARSKGG